MTDMTAKLEAIFKTKTSTEATKGMLPFTVYWINGVLLCGYPLSASAPYLVTGLEWKTKIANSDFVYRNIVRNLSHSDNEREGSYLHTRRVNKKHVVY